MVVTEQYKDIKMKSLFSYYVDRPEVLDLDKFPLPENYTGIAQQHLNSKLVRRIVFYKNGLIHNENGFGVIGKLAFDYYEYWLNNEKLTEKQYFMHPIMLRKKLEEILKL